MSEEVLRCQDLSNGFGFSSFDLLVALFFSSFFLLAVYVWVSLLLEFTLPAVFPVWFFGFHRRAFEEREGKREGEKEKDKSFRKWEFS